MVIGSRTASIRLPRGSVSHMQVPVMEAIESVFTDSSRERAAVALNSRSWMMLK